jgi:hypothetical protein
MGDRDRGGGRGGDRGGGRGRGDREGGGRGGGNSARDKNSDPGGKKKSSGPGPKFIRNIPNFLQQYSHLLSTNKKNYMGEELGEDDGGPTTADEIRESGGQVVGEDADRGEGEREREGGENSPPGCDGEGEGEDEAPVVVGGEEESHDVFREKAPGIDGIDVAVSSVHPTDSVAKPNSFKKVEFSRPQKRKSIEEEEDEDAARSSKKRDYKSTKKASMLSFDVEDD